MRIGRTYRNDQNYCNIKQGKNDRFKNGLKADRGFFSSGSVGEFSFAANALLVSHFVFAR